MFSAKEKRDPGARASLFFCVYLGAVQQPVAGWRKPWNGFRLPIRV